MKVYAAKSPTSNGKDFLSRHSHLGQRLSTLPMVMLKAKEAARGMARS